MDESNKEIGLNQIHAVTTVRISSLVLQPIRINWLNPPESAGWE